MQDSTTTDIRRAGPWLMIAGFFGTTAIAAGAYGWHSLGDDVIFMMGVDYHVWHAIALLGVAWVATHPTSFPPRLTSFIGICFSLGIFLFSGTLYAFGLWNTVPITGAAPLGGGLLIAGWAAFMWGGWKVMAGKDPDRT